LSTQDTVPLHTPDKQGRADLPKTLSRYKRKLKKFVGQWHASLVKKGIPEYAAYKLARHCVQTGDEEGDSGTDSYMSRMKPLFPTSTATLLRGTQLFQASTQVLPDVLNHRDADKGEKNNNDIPSRPVGLVLIQPPRTDHEPIVIELGDSTRASKQGLGGNSRPATLVEALRAKLRVNILKSHHEEVDRAFDTLAVARRLQERDFTGRLSSQEICVIGIAVLHKVFGGRGQKRLADAITHLYSRHPRRHLADLDRNAGKVAEEIRKGSPATLSSFTLR
jgi:hypothetical protein